MKAQRFKLESIRYRAGEYKCEDCGLLCIAGEVIRAEDFDAYRAKVRALFEAAEALLEFTDSDGDGPLVINDHLDKLKAALAALEAE